MEGMQRGVDYKVPQYTAEEKRLHAACAAAMLAAPEAVKAFRKTVRDFIQHWKNPEAITTNSFAPAHQDALAEVLAAAVVCRYLRKITETTYTLSFNQSISKDRKAHIDKVSLALDGGFLEAYVASLLTKSERYASVLHGIKPIGSTQSTDFGETDFLAYSPKNLSLSLISCKSTEPKLEHYEAILARREKLGGKFAKGVLCMTAASQNGNEEATKTRLRLFNIQGAFYPELPNLLR